MSKVCSRRCPTKHGAPGSLAWRIAEQTADQAWLSDLRDGDVRLLVLVHRMAARRLGFPNLYAALNDGSPQSMSDGIADGTAWPLRPFTQHLLPMIVAVRDEDQFAVMSLLRAESPHLQADRLRGQVVGPVLTALQQAVDTLRNMLADGSLSTIRQVLQHARDTGLLSLDERFTAHFVAEPADDGSSGYANVAAFLACVGGTRRRGSRLQSVFLWQISRVHAAFR